MRSRNQLFLLGSLLIVAGALAGPARAQSSARLFEDGDIDSPRMARDAGGPRVLRARTARLRAAALDAAARDGLAGVATADLELNLFPDAALRGVFERFATDRLGHRTWVGRIAGDPLSTVTLTWRDGIVVGGVQTADTVYRVQGTMDAAVIEQVDPASFGEEREPVAVAADALAIWPAAPPPVAADGEVADILVYYTPAARSAQGGTAAIEALIATAVADANTAYGRSGIAATLRLAAAVELTGYVESADMSNDLNFLRGNAGVAAARDSVGADLVALIVAASTGGACGIGYLGPSASYAHSVTARTCIVGNYTFAHEVGHNLGSHHAPEDGASGAWKTYAYGYKDYTANFRTVMAYAPGARILNFSNPDVLHNGRATGSATQRNALALREAFPIVQGFRSAVPPAVAPGAPRNLASTVNGNLVSLSWQAPATGVPTAYVLQVGTAPGAANLFAGSAGLTTAISAPLPAGVYLRQGLRDQRGRHRPGVVGGDGERRRRCAPRAAAGSDGRRVRIDRQRRVGAPGERRGGDHLRGPGRHQSWCRQRLQRRGRTGHGGQRRPAARHLLRAGLRPERLRDQRGVERDRARRRPVVHRAGGAGADRFEHRRHHHHPVDDAPGWPGHRLHGAGRERQRGQQPVQRVGGTGQRRVGAGRARGVLHPCARHDRVR